MRALSFMVVRMNVIMVSRCEDKEHGSERGGNLTCYDVMAGFGEQPTSALLGTSGVRCFAG